MAHISYGSGDVYENPRRISPGIRELRIPIVDRDLTIEPSVLQGEYAPISEPTFKELKLQRYVCSLHLSMESLHNLRTFCGNDINSIEGINALVSHVSRATQSHLENMQPVSEGHPVIIDRVSLSEQIQTRQIVIRIDFWAIQHQDADLGRAAFERILHEFLSGSYFTSRERQLPQLGSSSFHRGGYEVNAEENAHELLKGMLTEKQFELYKLEGYILLKGTYGRTYKVNKNDMIDVQVKKKGCKENNYRLCIEPRDRGTICPTDEVIAKIKLIQSSEKELHEVGIKWNSYGSGLARAIESAEEQATINILNVELTHE